MPRDDYRANAPRWYAVRDALRHKFVPRRMFKTGRGASGTAFPRWSGNDDLCLEMTIVPMLRVGMQFVTLCVTSLCRAACSRQDAERPERHPTLERGNDDLCLEMTIVPMLRVGMQFVTLCVTNSGRTTCSRSDAERPERHSHAGAWER
ncbi:hypothetical protein ALO87_102031 [Pseudomonas syringae pv. apii]|nr:hypothetical protein ALO87_102031 [Pseudomonas syringae pv. apii]